VIREMDTENGFTNRGLHTGAQCGGNLRVWMCISDNSVLMCRKHATDLLLLGNCCRTGSEAKPALAKPALAKRENLRAPFVLHAVRRRAIQRVVQGVGGSTHRRPTEHTTGESAQPAVRDSGEFEARRVRRLPQPPSFGLLCGRSRSCHLRTEVSFVVVVQG